MPSEENVRSWESSAVAVARRVTTSGLVGSASEMTSMLPLPPPLLELYIHSPLGCTVWLCDPPARPMKPTACGAAGTVTSMTSVPTPGVSSPASA